MDWTVLGSKDYIPVVSHGWARFSISWLDYPGQQSVIKIRFNLPEPSEILSAGVKKFLFRQYFSEIPAVSKSVVLFPDAYDTFIFPNKSPFTYSVEISKVVWRKSLISEPLYSISAYASRIDL